MLDTVVDLVMFQHFFMIITEWVTLVLFTVLHFQHGLSLVYQETNLLHGLLHTQVQSKLKVMQ